MTFSNLNSMLNKTRVDSASIFSDTWWVQNAGTSYAANTIDTNTIRFEVRGGDNWYVDNSRKERSEIADRTEFANGQGIKVNYSFSVAPGSKNTADWFVIGQFHQNDDRNAPGYSPPFAIEMLGERLAIVVRYESSPGVVATRYLWKDSKDIVRGADMKMDIEARFDPKGNGYLHVERDGVTLVDYKGALGYHSQKSVYWKQGIYREASAETVVAEFSDIHVSALSSQGSPPPVVTPTTPTGAIAVTITGKLLNDNGSLDSDRITNDGRIAISGTSTAYSDIAVFDKGVKIGTAFADGSGKWTLAHTLSDGSHSLAATATLGGATGSATLSEAFVVDRTAPGKATIVGLTHDTGASATDGVTSDNTLGLRGTAEANARVEVMLDGNRVGTAVADSTGHWTYDSTTVMSDRFHTIQARAVDMAGNLGALSDSRIIQVDTTAKAIDIRTAYQDSAVTTLVGVAEAGSQVTVRDGGSLLGKVTAASNGIWSLVVSTPVSSPRELTALAEDKAGNVAHAVGETLMGGLGNDRLVQHQSAGAFFGGAGKDVFVLEAGLADGGRIIDFAGRTDKIVFEGYDAARGTVKDLGNNSWQVSDGVHTDRIVLSNGYKLLASDWSFA